MRLKQRLLTSAALIVTISTASAESHNFKWLDRQKDSALFNSIQTAFADELTPGAPKDGSILKTVKFIDRIAVRGRAALVLIGEKEHETASYVASYAFNFDLGTKLKLPIGDKYLQRFWMWRLERVARLTSVDDSDIVFRFLDCTECEAAHLLAAFHYSSSKKRWDLRQWGNKEGPWLKIGEDGEPGDEGIYWYDCLHVVADLSHHGLDEVAVRCRESVQPDLNKPEKRVTRDETFLYRANSAGQLTPSLVDKGSEYFATVHAALCATQSQSPLCRKPATAPRRSSAQKP